MIEADCALSPASLGTAAVIGVAGDCQGTPEWTCESRGLASCQMIRTDTRAHTFRGL